MQMPASLRSKPGRIIMKSDAHTDITREPEWDLGNTA
jgi:hypothetical protein